MTKSFYVFDFDGTLVNPLYETFAIFNRISDEFGFRKVEAKEIERLRSIGTRAVIKAMGIPFYKIPFIIKRFRQEFSKKIGK